MQEQGRGKDPSKTGYLIEDPEGFFLLGKMKQEECAGPNREAEADQKKETVQPRSGILKKNINSGGQINHKAKKSEIGKKKFKHLILQRDGN